MVENVVLVELVGKNPIVELLSWITQVCWTGWYDLLVSQSTTLVEYLLVESKLQTLKSLTHLNWT